MSCTLNTCTLARLATAKNRCPIRTLAHHIPLAPCSTAHHAQQSSGATTSNANATSNYDANVNGSGAPAYHAAPYTSLGSVVTPSYSVSAAHTLYSRGSAQYSSGASGVSEGPPYSPLEWFWCDVFGWGAGAGAGEGAGQAGVCVFFDGLHDTVARKGVRWRCGEQGGVACAQYATPTPVPVNGSMARRCSARRRAGGGGPAVFLQDLYFYTLASSPVSSTSTSANSTTSESCSASEESTSESESEGEEERYDALAYTERSTDFATRHTPAAADFVQPRTHRPTAYLSSPASAASAASDEGDAEIVPAPCTPCPSSDTWHSSGDTRAWAAEQARRMRRLRVVPADPSAHPYRPQQQEEEGTGGGGACRARGRRLCGWESGRLRGIRGRRRRGVSGRGTAAGGWAAAIDAPDAAHDEPGTATPAACPGAPATAYIALAAYTTTHAAPAPAVRRPARAYDDAVDAPAPAYAVAGHGQWTPPPWLPRFADLERWSPGVEEVVPSHAPQVPSHAPQVPSHALVPPAHTHAPSHTLPQLARSHRHRCRATLCLLAGPLSGWATPPFCVLLAGYPAVPLFHRPPIPSTPTYIDY
ncbi:hypothetical protein C8J57DRAFT_1251645 [Mycena rebaudengoi]|nr:hypothetical protein C8J57DRAFT_1251645 [Mycena rebaudengoi]